MRNTHLIAWLYFKEILENYYFIIIIQKYLYTVAFHDK